MSSPEHPTRGDNQPPKRIGRPPLPPELRAEPTHPRSVRLTDAEWAELQRRGTPALREWLACRATPGSG